RGCFPDPWLNSNTAFNRTLSLLYSRNLKHTKQTLKQYNISYILITKKMLSGGVWNSADEGLLFLLRNNETFKRVYEVNGNQVWQVLS
ncbi:hypothetical protein KY318_01425, partial [Candidatus Woesearchaeota archaeon]|nr:hypothetical protein [Candidatus Woesearchaeota archaeon]